ncbi:hypothetical protein DFQ26_008502 [Actinomortierella ambigua]|nr:hypothetical protein DFQ26_008502 [Actinomortierella ambigua]
MSSTTASSSASSSGSNGSCTSTSSSSSSNSGTPPIITTTAPEHSATIPSFAAIRRARADTLPSRPSSLAFLAGSGRGVSGTGAGEDSIGSAGASVAAFSQLDSKSTRPLRRTPSFLVPPHLSTRHRSGSLTLPSASISAAFGPSIFTSSWGEPTSPGSDRPATTPTTREMMFDSENENAIMSTLDALGLDDPVSVPGQPSNQSVVTASAVVSNSSLDGLGPRSRSSSFASLTAAVNGTSEMHLHKTAMDASLLMPNLGLANRFRSYSVTAKPTYQEVLEDEQGDNIGQLTSSSPSSGSSSTGVVYPATSAGGVHQFHQTHSRPRAISMGFLEIPNDIVDEQRRFALAGPRSYSDMKARQTHQRTTSAGADRLAEIVANSSSLNGSSGGPSPSSSSTSVSAAATAGSAAAAAAAGVGAASSLSSASGINHGISSSSGSSTTHTHTNSSTPPSLSGGAVANIKALGHGRTSSLNLVSSSAGSQHGLGANRVQDDVTLGHHHPQHHHHHHLLALHHLESSGLNVSFTADRQELNGTSGGHAGATMHFGNNLAGTPPGTLTPPLQENGFSSANVTQQVPTRSLWIGNLDPSLTTNDLMKLCSPYGQIESLRVLPDKECAFVNFMTVEDAVRAKEDISERCGGRVGNHVVRVGFGKTEVLMNPDSSNALQSTRALWIGNLPPATTPGALHAIFSHFGPIESARVLAHKSCGFINFDNIEDAITAKKIMHGQEAFGPGTGAIRVGFAKVPTKQSPSDSPNTLQHELGGSEGILNADSKSGSSTSLNAMSKQQQQQEIDGKAEFDMMLNMMTLANNGQSLTSSSTSTERELPSPEDTVFERLAMMQEFDKDADAPDAAQELRLNLEPISYYSSIPAVPEPSPRRRLDAPRLREIRKRLDSGHCAAKEVDALANECMDEIVELCSDYIGNTVIQKFFERASETQKTKMLELIAPHLASIGIHKNGTWAAQKIIECAKTAPQIELICMHLRPYTPPLLLDQFGNYVVQCCLRLGSQHNEFIFQAMADKFWEIAQGRFGARAMRASLESQHVTKRQQKQVAVAVVQNSLALATNPNGALLLTWLLDNSQLAGRYRVLAPRLAPHVASLATHKLASLTVLKVINQRQEADARDLLLKAISTNDAALEEILGDQVHGISLIQKILASPHVELTEKQALAEKVKSSLQKLNVLNVQGCKRLLEEIKVVLGGGEDADGKHSSGAVAAAMPGAVANSLLVYPQQEFAATAANFYVAMATNQQQQQQQHLQAQMAIKAVPPPGGEAVGDHSPPPSHSLGGTGAGAAGKGPETGSEMGAPNGGAGGAGGVSMTQGAATFVAHPAGFYAPMPSQMFGGYPGHQMAAAAAFYPNGLYVPHQAITTMYHPGMMAAAAAAGFNPYLAMAAGMNGTDAAAAAAAAGMAAAGMAAQLNGSAGMFLPHQGAPPHGLHHHAHHHHHLAQPHLQPSQFQSQPSSQQPSAPSQQQQQQQQQQQAQQQ